MPRTAIPYVPKAYDLTPGTIRMSEIQRRIAADQADLALRQGDISANLGANLAGIAGNVASAIGQYAAEAPKRKAAEAQTQRAGAIDAALRGAVDPATGKINPKTAARDVAAIDPIAAQQWWDRANEEEKVDLLKKGETIKAIANVAGSLLMATEKMDPKKRQDAYTEARQDLISRGLAREEDIDPVYKPSTLKAQVSMALTAAEKWKELEAAIVPPKTRQITIRNPDGTESIQIVEDMPGQTFTSTPEPKPTIEQEAARAAAIAEAQARAQAKFRQPTAGAAPNYQKIETVDDAGNPVVTWMTPEEVRAKGGVPTSPKTTAKASGPATVSAILTEIDDLSKKINTQGQGLGANVVGLFRQAAAAANMDNTVSEYDALVKGFIPMMARAVGHTGVLTQQDVDSVRALFPKPTDNAALATNKLARVERLMTAMQQTPGAEGQSFAQRMAAAIGATAAPLRPGTTVTVGANPFRK